MPFVRRPTVDLHYEDHGVRNGPCVVLMPSLLCDASMFAHLSAQLETRYRVIEVDLRGHGRSVPVKGPHTLEDQADDLAAVLDDAEVPAAGIVGLSQGGMTALRMAIYHPRRVRAMVVMDASAAPEGNKVRAKYMAMAWTFRSVGLLRPVEQEVARLMFSAEFRAAHPERVEHELAGWRTLDRLGIFHATRAVALRTDIRADLATVVAPTLVITGERDAALPPRLGEEIAKLIPRATMKVVRGAGHLSTIEQPDATTAMVSAFLDEQLGATTPAPRSLRAPPR